MWRWFKAPATRLELTLFALMIVIWSTYGAVLYWVRPVGATLFWVQP